MFVSAPMFWTLLVLAVLFVLDVIATCINTAVRYRRWKHSQRFRRQYNAPVVVPEARP